MKHQSTSSTFGGYQQPTKVNLEIAKLIFEIYKFRVKIRECAEWLRAWEANSENVHKVKELLLLEYFPTTTIPHAHKINVVLKYNFMNEPYFAFTWAGIDAFKGKDE